MKLFPAILPFGCTLAIGLLAALLPLHAQTTPASRTSLQSDAKEVPQRNLAVCFLLAPTVPELYFRDAYGNYQLLKIDIASFNTWNVIPARPTLEIFQKNETSESKTTDPVTRKVVVTPARITFNLTKTWKIPSGTTDIRKLFYYAANGQVLEYNFATAADTHGAYQARVINLAAQRVMLRLENQKQMLAASAETTLTVATAPEQVFRFQYGIEIPDSTPYISPIKRLRFHKPQERLTIIIGYLPVTEMSDDGTRKVIRYDTDDIRFFEEVNKLPKPPKPVLAR